MGNANKSLKTQYISSSFDITVATVISKDKEYCNNNLFDFFKLFYTLSLFQKEENNNNKKLCEREKIYHFRVIGCKIKNTMWGVFLKW